MPTIRTDDEAFRTMFNVRVGDDGRSVFQSADRAEVDAFAQRFSTENSLRQAYVRFQGANVAKYVAGNLVWEARR